MSEDQSGPDITPEQEIAAQLASLRKLNLALVKHNEALVGWTERCASELAQSNALLHKLISRHRRQPMGIVQMAFAVALGVWFYFISVLVVWFVIIFLFGSAAILGGMSGR